MTPRVDAETGKLRRKRATAGRELESALADLHGTVAGIDEVGRGCLAGPVTVGVALVDTNVGEAPLGLTDSKALTARARCQLFPQVQSWVRAYALGWASAAEIDQVGIVCALRLAARRALADLEVQGFTPGVVLLDGSHNWLTPPSDLLASIDSIPLPGSPALDGLTVHTKVKADRDCAVVSAASVLAKVTRDAHMCALPDPGYDWAKNKGYASRAHIDALGKLGPCDEHRRSWKLPGVA